MKTHNIRLIDNTYDLDIARRLLDGLLDQKMQFMKDMLQETNLSNVEHRKQLETRMEDLKAEKRSLQILFEEHDGEHVEMEIGCTVVMSIKKDAMA